MIKKQTLLNPDDFVITHRRKKYKFARFFNAPNCYELDQWQRRAVDVIEIGAGTGLFSVELAQRYPERQHLAVDVKADRLQRGAYEALEHGVGNLSFVRVRADQVGELVVPASVGQIWLTFPDPFPRERSARRRLTHPHYLEIYRQILRPDGRLLLKHDDPQFFAWSVEQLEADGWQIQEISYDLHASDLPDDYKIHTSYEQRWLDAGRTVHLVSASV